MGSLDYRGFKKHEGKLDRYLHMLAKTDTRALSRNEQFAFYINAYNAWSIKLILSDYPGITSIKDLGSIFWYADDFNDDIVGFFLKYAKGNTLVKLKENRSEIDVEYLDYDWSLNWK